MFSVPKQSYAALPEPPAWISVLYYPHTLAVIAWRELDVSEYPANATGGEWDEPHPDWGSDAEAWPAPAPGPPPDAAPPAWPPLGEPPPLPPYSATWPGSDPP